MYVTHPFSFPVIELRSLSRRTWPASSNWLKEAARRGPGKPWCLFVSFVYEQFPGQEEVRALILDEEIPRTSP